jgi:hypothetical protein
VSGQFHALTALPPAKEPPGTHWMGGCVGPRAGLEDMEKRQFLILLGLELQRLGRPAWEKYRNFLILKEVVHIVTTGI